ncbi:MAG: hypothetical protein JXB32_16015 [Deltaproteobacteria bacterium]|nr:hypothetical protein [Deltaproteobacteria bacterium]
MAAYPNNVGAQLGGGNVEWMLGATPAGSNARTDAASRETVAVAALRVERAVAVARLVFLGAILVRFLAVGATRWPSGVATIVPLSVGLVFSAAVLMWARRPPRGEALWLGSVSVDALACFGALLPNALWPSPEFPGVAGLPDTAAILLATAAAGLRLSPIAAMWAGLLNAASLIALVHIDAAVSGTRFATGLGPVSMYLTWVLGSGLVAVILARTIRRLVLRSAETAARTARAEQGLWTVLAEHHDLRSMLGAVSIRSDLLAEAYADPKNGASAERLRRQAEELRDGLARIRRVVEEVRGRALGDLAQARRPEPVVVAEVVGRVAEQLRLRFPEVALRIEPIDPRLAALVAGGETSLERILVNLLHNACEGNGRTGSATVSVAATMDAEARMLRVTVRDDGPGLPDVPGRSERATPAKPGGTGVGLSVVRGLVEGSGGVLTLARGEAGGTTAGFSLPLVPPT